MRAISFARQVHLNQHLFPSNALFLTAFRIAKIAGNFKTIENKANAYFLKVLKISLATLKRYFIKLIKIGFIKRDFNYKNNGEQTISTITINTGFFNGQRGAQNEPQISIFSKEKNTNTETETSSSSLKDEKSTFQEQLNFEKRLKDSKMDNLILQVDGGKIDFVEIRGKKLLRKNNRIIKSTEALGIFKTIFKMKENIDIALKAVKLNIFSKIGVSNSGDFAVADGEIINILKKEAFLNILNQNNVN
jgi:hypothetical protein